MPLSPTVTREILHQIEHVPNKKLGQNFLIDGNIVRKSIELAEIDSTSLVVEIGAGLGTLTQAILDTGAHLWAIERDPKLSAYLRSSLLENAPKCCLSQGDCLEEPLAGLTVSGKSKDFKIIANLPYAVATPWMNLILSKLLPSRMVLMLQKETADRYAADPGSKTFGAISVFLQSSFSLHSSHLVKGTCFLPIPKVDSVLMRLDQKENPVHFSDPAKECIRRIFTHRRKQLGAICKRESNPQISAWFDSLLNSGISPTVRPEALPIDCWQLLANLNKDI